MALVVGELGDGRVAVGQEDEPVILLVVVVEVDGWLEVGAAAAGDTDAAGGLLEGDGLVGRDLAVKLDDIDALVGRSRALLKACREYLRSVKDKIDTLDKE